VLAALVMLLGISAAVVWTWQRLEQHQQREQHHRFALNTQALAEIMTARMQAYEMVLRGVSSAFAGDGEEVRPQVSHARWAEIMAQLQLQKIYPGVSSVAWTRYLRAEALDEFISSIRADGRPEYRVFPPGQRQAYQLLEHIGPLNARTRAVWGLDLLTQTPQNETIAQAVDSGEVTLSPPLPDLYAVSSEASRGVGAFMYLPLYQYGRLPQTREERHALVVGTLSLAFRGDELVEGVFGTRLRLFHVTARDDETGQLVFDSTTKADARPPGWQPQFSSQIDLPLYGRTWRLDVTSTPEYEQASLSRSQDLVLLIGLSTALLVALLTGAFVWLRDQQLHASQVVGAKLHDQAEQLILANRYKSEFLANMSHELRTPLNSILILSDQLRQNAGGNLSEKQVRHTDIVYRAGSDLLQLINDVLDLAKVEAGRMQLSMEPLNLQDLLVDLDASMRPLAEAKKLHLHIPPITPESGVPLRVVTDHVRLHQILRNLLSNAIKFTDQGQVSVTIGVGETRKDGRRVVHFVVRDSGIGIDPAQHKQAFEPFQQLDGSTRRRYGGTGLGLAITRQLAQALDGDITLQSALGQGATFTVHLPMQTVSESSKSDVQATANAGVALQATAPVTVTPATTSPAIRPNLQGRRLLLVDDDIRNVYAMSALLDDFGLRITTAGNGEEAIARFQQDVPDVILMDMSMPVMDGYIATNLLKTKHGCTIPIIALTAHAMKGDREKCLAAGADDYISKPVERGALRAMLERWLAAA